MRPLPLSPPDMTLNPSVTLVWSRSDPRRATAAKSAVADLDNYRPKSQVRFRFVVHPSRLAALAPQDDGYIVLMARPVAARQHRLARLTAAPAGLFRGRVLPVTPI